MKSSNTSKRIIYFDILNILACIAVVLLHHNGLTWGYDGTNEWKQSIIIEVLFYYAVPIFLMLSGATLLNYRKKYDTKTFFKKRFTKILIPFIFWATIMFIWKISLGELHIVGPRSLLNTFLNNEEMSIYYFMFLILGVYLSMPIFSKIIDKDEQGGKKVLRYAVITLFITQCILPTLLGVSDVKYNSSLTPQISSSLIYVFLGYLLSTTDFSKKQRVMLYIIACASCVFRYVEIITLSTVQNTTVINDATCRFSGVLLASALFVFIKNVEWDKIFMKNKKIVNLLSGLAGCSFGVYLIHMLIMHYEMIALNLDAHSIVWRLFCPFLTYLISICLVLLMKKIPFIKRLVP